MGFGLERVRFLTRRHVGMDLCYVALFCLPVVTRAQCELSDWALPAQRPAFCRCSVVALGRKIEVRETLPFDPHFKDCIQHDCTTTPTSLHQHIDTMASEEEHHETFEVRHLGASPA